MAGIEKIFFGHDHGDHTLGLMSFIGCRNNCQGTSKNKETMGEHNKPLTIYYPKESTGFNDIIKFIENRYGNWLRYKLTWVPISAGTEIEIGKDTWVRAFDMKHNLRPGASLGYVIYTNRTRLRPEYVGQDISALIKSGADKNSLSMTYRANLFGYCLDAFEIPDGHKELSECDNVIMDCTFLKSSDRTDPTHFTMDESLANCHNWKVKNMYAAHISPRYDNANHSELAPASSDLFKTKLHILSNREVNHI